MTLMRNLVMAGAVLAAVIGNVSIDAAQTASPTVPATQPATRPAGRTDHDLFREIAEFDQKYVVEAYEKQGRRDAKWDVAAMKLVRAQYEASLAGSYLGGHYIPEDCPPAMPASERAALGKELLNAGCDDAMALLMAAFALDEAGDACAGQAFELADKNAAASPYVPIYKLLMFHQAVQRTEPLSEDDPELAKMRERFRAILRNVLSDKETLPKYRAVIWAKGDFVFESDNEDSVDRIATAMMNVEDPDPWLMSTYLGHAEIQRAWKARGGGWANTVTDEGWAGFRKHLDYARQHLEQATEIDKTLPHAPALLVTVALGESSPDAELWFRKAIERQIDYTPAYNNYRSIVQPRWGGSVEAQLKLAKQCVATGRFDTRVPQLASDVINDIERDDEGSLDPTTIAQVAPIIEKAMAGYAGAAKTENVRRWADSTRLVWIVLEGKWPEARRLLDTMPAVEDSAATNRDIDPRELIGKTLAMTHPQANDIRAAVDVRDAAKRAEALEKLLSAMTDDDVAGKSIVPARAASAKRWVERRMIEAQFEASLAGGQWTPLPIAKDLANWTLSSGEWKVDGDNAIVGTSKNGLLAVAPFQLPERYEFRCTVELVGEAELRQKLVKVFPVWSPGRAISCDVTLSEGRGNLTNGRYTYGLFPVALSGDSTSLAFRYDNGAISALDEAGRVIVTGTPPRGRSRKPAFGGMPNGSGVTWRFSDIQVRALK